MWTPAARAQLARDACADATRLTDAEWPLVAPLLSSATGKGRPRCWPMWPIIDAILYVLRTGRALGRRRLPSLRERMIGAADHGGICRASSRLGKRCTAGS